MTMVTSSAGGCSGTVGRGCQVCLVPGCHVAQLSSQPASAPKTAVVLVFACVCVVCRSELLQAALHKVEQEVAQEVASYKATRKAEELQRLAGHLSEDIAAAAQKLEKQTAELQRLEAAVADRATVLQKLSDQVASKQREQLQQQQQLLESLSGSISGDRCADGQLLASCKDQLASVQLQLSQAEKQLSTADAVLVERRAAVAEAEEQLASVRRETSVCEPRLTSLRQQLQELEANIRARDTEHQV